MKLNLPNVNNGSPKTISESRPNKGYVFPKNIGIPIAIAKQIIPKIKFGIILSYFFIGFVNIFLNVFSAGISANPASAKYDISNSNTHKIIVIIFICAANVTEASMNASITKNHIMLIKKNFPKYFVKGILG